MPVTVYLERNAKLYPNEIALVELNPEDLLQLVRGSYASLTL